MNKLSDRVDKDELGALARRHAQHLHVLDGRAVARREINVVDSPHLAPIVAKRIGMEPKKAGPELCGVHARYAAQKPSPHTTLLRTTLNST